MSVEENVKVITEAVQALNARDWEGYGAAFSESLVAYAPGLTEPARGRAARLQYVQGIIQAIGSSKTHSWCVQVRSGTVGQAR